MYEFEDRVAASPSKTHALYPVIVHTNTHITKAVCYTQKRNFTFGYDLTPVTVTSVYTQKSYLFFIAKQQRSQQKKTLCIKIKYNNILRRFRLFMESLASLHEQTLNQLCGIGIKPYVIRWSWWILVCPVRVCPCVCVHICLQPSNMWVPLPLYYPTAQHILKPVFIFGLILNNKWLISTTICCFIEHFQNIIRVWSNSVSVFFPPSKFFTSSFYLVILSWICNAYNVIVMVVVLSFCFILNSQHGKHNTYQRRHGQKRERTHLEIFYLNK